MIRDKIIATLVGAFALAGAAIAAPAPAAASEALPAGVAQQLDGQAAEFTQSAASQRRHMIIRQNMRAQRGYGYGPRRGYGPPRGYGYGRGYGPRPGYGPPRGYDRRGY